MPPPLKNYRITSFDPSNTISDNFGFVSYYFSTFHTLYVSFFMLFLFSKNFYFIKVQSSN